MRHRHRHQLKNVFIVLFAFVLILIVVLVGQRIGLENLVALMKANPAVGLLIYFTYMVVSSVVIPLPVSPLWPVALYIYGFWAGLVVTVAGTTLGAGIAFWLARKYGKPFVKSMVGNKLFSELSHLIEIKSVKALVLVRLLGNNYFDLISYIVGLSKIPFLYYILTTFIISCIWIGIFFVAIQKVGGLQNIESFLSLLGVYSLVMIVGTVIWEIYHRLHKR